MIDKYNFQIGEKLIDIYGRRGVISYVSHCERCEERGFYEFIAKWDYDPDVQDWITCCQEQNGFPGIYKIGDRIFSPLNLKAALKDLDNMEKTINTLLQEKQILEQGIQFIRSQEAHS